MIAQKISILPSLSKNKEKRLVLNRKSDNARTFTTNKSTISNNDIVENKKFRQIIAFHIRRPARLSTNNNKFPFDLVLEANEKVNMKRAQFQSRSLSSLLFRRQNFQQSSFGVEESKTLKQQQLQNSQMQISDDKKILQQVQTIECLKDQKLKYGKVSSIRNQDQDSNLQVKQCIQHFLKSDCGKNQYAESVLKAQKKFVSVGVSTDFEMGPASYKQFLKFKIMQSQKYDQFQHLFQYMDNLYYGQMRKFRQRQEEIRNLYEKTKQTKRQFAMQQIINEKRKIQQQISQYLITTIQQFENRKKDLFVSNVIQIKKIQEQINNLKNDRSFTNPNSEQISHQISPQTAQKLSPVLNIKNNHTSNNLNLKNKLTQITSILLNFEQKTNNNIDQILEKLTTNLKNVQSKFSTWKNCLTQKEFMLELCIEDLIKLPQMSITIFGMGDHMETEKQALKKIGIILDDIPQFGEHFHKKEICKNVDKNLGQLIDLKCMNCSYLKSKMRFIYEKNKEIKTVIKILKRVIKKEKKNMF